MSTEIRLIHSKRVIEVIAKIMMRSSAEAEIMASITVRNLDDDLKSRLRVQVAVHGRSMEEEVRGILRMVLSNPPEETQNLVTSIRARVAEFGGVDLPELPRELVSDPPIFE